MDKKTISLDIIGCLVSFLCAVHCAILPVLLSAGMIINLGWIASGYFDWILLVSSLLIAFRALSKGFMHHYKHGPSFLALAGFLLMGAGLGRHHVLMVGGGVFIIVAHLLNWYWMAVDNKVKKWRFRLINVVIGILVLAFFSFLWINGEQLFVHKKPVGKEAFLEKIWIGKK